MLIRKKPSAKSLGAFGLWRLATLSVLGLMGILTVGSAYFVYVNIFQTLSNANQVVILRAGPHFEAIDTSAAQKIEEALALKAVTYTIPSPLRNPFYYVSSTSATGTVVETPVIPPPMTPSTTSVKPVPTTTLPASTTTTRTQPQVFTSTPATNTPKTLPTSSVKR